MATTATARYSFDNSTEESVKQMRYLSEILDEPSLHRIRQARDLTGAECLEIGAGSGTISAWLAEAVGPDGHVTVTDLNPRHLDHLNGTATVMRLDVRTDPMEESAFDLIHARLVLMHLPERVEVLNRLTRALRPGGVLIVTEWQCTIDDLVVHAPDDAMNKAFIHFNRVFLQHIANNGADYQWPVDALSAMRDAGLDDVTTYVDARTWPGGTAGCMILYSGSFHLEAPLRDAGLTTSDLDDVRAALIDPQFVLRGYLTHTTIGRRP